MRFVSIIWKTVVVAGALLVGLLTANQVGWSGAEVVLTAPIMGLADTLGTTVIFAISALITVGSIILIYRIAKHVLWFAAPVFLYLAFVLGAWNGYMSDFDATRALVLQHGYANALALERMRPRGRDLTCKEGLIELSDDAKAICSRSVEAVGH